MKIIQINVKEIPNTSRYLKDSSFRRDLVGQIIEQLSDKVIQPKTRTPTEVSFTVSPITVEFRGRFILTPTGYNLLQITKQPRGHQIAIANQLLSPQGIKLTPGESVTPSRSVQNPLEQAYKEMG